MDRPLIEDGVPPPPVRVTKRRLTDAHRAIGPGQSILCEPKTALCLMAWGRSKGFKMQQRQEGDALRVWRLT